MWNYGQSIYFRKVGVWWRSQILAYILLGNTGKKNDFLRHRKHSSSTTKNTLLLRIEVVAASNYEHNQHQQLHCSI